MYHERQTRQMCLVHTLNSLLQKKEFTAHSLDDICFSLNGSRWFNPHRSLLGLGNYDANVLMAALAMHDFEVAWFDSRMHVDRINFELLHAMIFNISSKFFLPLWNSRHWFTVLRTADGKFINLDSKLEKPEEIENIILYSQMLLENEKDQNQLILVSKCDPGLLIKSP